MRTPYRHPRGVVALITVLVVMVVLVSIGLTVSIIGRDEIALSGVFQDGEQAFAFADACTEEGLQQLKSNPSYTGGSFALDDGTCSLAITDLGGNDRFVVGTGLYLNAIRIIEANVTIQSNGGGDATKVKINSWQEAN